MTIETPQAEKPNWKDFGLVFGFYPFLWRIRPTWGPFVHTINLGPFAMTFIF